MHWLSLKDGSYLTKLHLDLRHPVLDFGFRAVAGFGEHLYPAMRLNFQDGTF